MDKNDRKPSGWAVALVIAGAIAIIEGLAGAIVYREMPLNVGSFFVVYITAYAAGSAFFVGAFAMLVVLVWKRSAAAIAVGIGIGWFVILTIRCFGIRNICFTVGAKTNLALWPFITAAAVGALVLGVIAYFLGRSKIGSVRFALPVIGILALVAVATFISRSKPTGVPVSQENRSKRSSQFVSPIVPESTNILLVVIDTLRADHTSPYGYPRNTTPYLKALADKGVLFERCITQRTNTAPAMATLFTGVYPPQSRVLNNNNILQDFNETWAEILARHGYVTAGVCGNTACGKKFNFNQGFVYFEEVFCAGSIVAHEEGSLTVNQAAIKWLEEHYSERFFLWVHYVDPHTPYIVPNDFKNLYTTDALSSANQHRQLSVGSSEKGRIHKSALIDDSRDMDFYISQYDAEIRYNDERMGELFNTLSRLGIRDNTLVIVTADHGESMGEHNYLFFHGGYCYEACAHVPLVFAHPSLPAGARIETTVSLIDMLPTMLDLLCIPKKDLLQGESFAASLVDPTKALGRQQHYIIGSYRASYQTHAVTTDRYKLVFDVDERWVYMDVGVEALARVWFGKAFPSRYHFRVIRRELYNLSEDRRETFNISNENVAVQRELENYLWEWIEATYRTDMLPEVKGRDLTTEKDLVEKLRGLGYVE